MEAFMFTVANAPRIIKHLYHFQVILKLKSNSLAWNPMEAFMFTVANEDYK